MIREGLRLLQEPCCRMWTYSKTLSWSFMMQGYCRCSNYTVPSRDQCRVSNFRTPQPIGDPHEVLCDSLTVDSSWMKYMAFCNNAKYIEGPRCALCCILVLCTSVPTVHPVKTSLGEQRCRKCVMGMHCPACHLAHCYTLTLNRATRLCLLVTTAVYCIIPERYTKRYECWLD
jgi:hypothetical protein